MLLLKVNSIFSIFKKMLRQISYCVTSERQELVEFRVAYPLLESQGAMKTCRGHTNSTVEES